MIDFQNVKSIVIPEGEVLNIKRGGQVLWQKILAPLYTELEYIESTGEQWIDIGSTINTATDEVEFVFQNTESVIYKWFFGEHDNNARFGLGSGDGANKRNVAYGNNTYKVADAQLYDSKHTFVANPNGVFIDGAKIANFASFASSSTLYLFNLNLSGGNYTSAAKAWSFKQSRNGALIRDLIPVLDGNGVPCMFDKVSGEFFYNKGTGQFLYGEKQTAPYKTELAYLESTGTQYIDTGIVGEDGVTADISLYRTTTTTNECFCGAYDGTHRLWLAYSFGNNWYRGYNNSAGGMTASIPAEVWTTISVSINNNTVTYNINGTGYSSTYAKGFTAVNNIFLFAMGTNSGAAYWGKGREGHCKLYKNDVLVRDLIPVLDWDDVPCMYDKVSGGLFYNQGTGEFLYGGDS